MPRRGECIYKRKDGRWEARYVREIGPDGKKKYASVYANSYRAVKDKQRYFMLYPVRDIKYTVNLYASELIQNWLGYVKNSVKLSTYLKYEGMCRNHIEPEIGKLPVRFISRTTVEAFTNSLREKGQYGGKALSVKTVNDILIVLNLLFDYAEEQFQINMPRVTFMREEKKEARVLSTEEQERLSSYLLKDMDDFKMGVFLSLYTGLRIGELCALLWEDIKDDCVTINKTMQRLKTDTGKTKVVIGSPKSDSSKRIVPLPQPLKNIIERYRKPNGYVICTPRSPYCEPRTVQQRFKIITDEIGLENVTFHTLRHTFATRCIEAGFDAKTLSEILGHSDVKVTLNRYVHSSFELKRLNMSKLSIKYTDD